MASLSARDRLTKLVDLASQSGVAARSELVRELADLLLDWPANYPAGMREPFETLLERALREADKQTRADLAERFAAKEDAPLGILNLLVFDAAPEIRNVIVSRNAAVCEGSLGVAASSASQSAFLHTIRKASTDCRAAMLAPCFGVPEEIAVQILAESSGYMLAVLCKGAQVGRATFSGVAVLALPPATAEGNYRRLAIYDTVSEAGAVALLGHWRAQVRAPAPAVQAA